MKLAHALLALSESSLDGLVRALRSGALLPDSSQSKVVNLTGMPVDCAESLITAITLLESTYGVEGAKASLREAAETAIAIRQSSAIRNISDLVQLASSGPIVEGVPMQQTAAVFSSMISNARTEVLITGYVATFARELLEPVADFLEADHSRKATIVLDFRRENDTSLSSDLASRRAEQFWTGQWRVGARRAKLYYDPRGLEPNRNERAAMHAKVVVVDRSVAFVTSANLTDRAQNDNIELGVLIRHAPIAKQLHDYFEGLCARGLLKEP